MPTFVEVSGADYPAEFNGKKIQPMEGQSLTPFLNKTDTKPRNLFWEHEGYRAVRDGGMKLVGSRGGPWELYNMSVDRTELNDLVKEQPETFAKLKTKWDGWAERVGVLTPKEFDAARDAFRKKNPKPKPKPAKSTVDATTLMCTPGELLFSEDFDRDSISDRWFYRGEFMLRDGALMRTRINDHEDNKRVFLKDTEFHNVVIQFDFNFE